MSPRKPAALRNDESQNLRDYLIAAAARLISHGGSAGLSVRDIAREAQVADGALYNYFEDKEDLLAHALLAHVGTVMNSAAPVPQAGSGTVTGNLRLFIDRGLAVLERVAPAFAGLVSQPRVLSRFHAMVGGDAAFGTAAAGHGGNAVPADQAKGQGNADPDDADQEDARPDDAGPRGLPESLTAYLRAEQRLGRIDADADVAAASTLIIGAIHGQVLPRVMFNPPGAPITTPPGFAAGLAETLWRGISPRSAQPQGAEPSPRFLITEDPRGWDHSNPP